MGGASGIGRATVVAFAERGASVVFTDLDEDGAAGTLARAGHAGRITFRCCDVTDGKALAAVIDSALERFGRLDIVADIAGVADGDLFADDLGDWRRVIDFNLTALIECTRLAVRAMCRAGYGGAVVNLASWAGLYPMAASPVYSATKAGVISFTGSLTSLAADSGIRVNAICPELVDTPLGVVMGQKVMAVEEMSALRASQSVLTPEDVAEWVVRLAEGDVRAGEILQLTKAEGGTYLEWPTA